jgi:tRNA modification GTPase
VVNTVEVDTIAAIATPSGRGAIGIIRLSGPHVPLIGAYLLGRLPKPRRAVLTQVMDDDGRALDQVVAIYFSRPASFTGEDVLEIQGHGSPVLQQALLARACRFGARLARPGEFSERAFLNGRIDLSQAEAISTLIESGTLAAARGAMASLEGVFGHEVAALADELVGLRVWIEAALDFPDEDIDFLADDRIGVRLADLQSRLAALTLEAQRGVVLAEGVTLSLAGAPNAGKSSLLNRLVGSERAIVTDVPGTTRDAIEDRIDIAGMPVRLIDTAGLRDSGDAIEREGIRRAREHHQRADQVLLVVDAASTPPAAWDIMVEAVGLQPVQERILMALNKVDSVEPGALVAWRDALRPDQERVVELSALTGQGIGVLVDMIAARAGHAPSETRFTARARHVDALRRAAEPLQRARLLAGPGGAGELLAEELRQAGSILGEITGTVTSDDLLGRIFASFCIGK